MRMGSRNAHPWALFQCCNPKTKAKMRKNLASARKDLLKSEELNRTLQRDVCEVSDSGLSAVLRWNVGPLFSGDLSLEMAAQATAELWRDRDRPPPRLCVEVSGVEEAWSRPLWVLLRQLAWPSSLDF